MEFKIMEKTEQKGRKLTEQESTIYNRLIKKVNDFDLQDSLQLAMTGIIENNKQFEDIDHYERYLKSALKKKRVFVVQDINLDENLSFNSATNNISGLNQDIINPDIIDHDGMTSEEIKTSYLDTLRDNQDIEYQIGYQRADYDDADDVLSPYSFETQKNTDMQKYIVKSLKTAQQKKIFILRYVLEWTMEEIAAKKDVSKMQVSRICAEIDRQILKMDIKQLINTKYYCGSGATASGIWSVYPDALPELNVAALKKMKWSKDETIKEKARKNVLISMARIDRASEDLIDLSRDVPLTGQALPAIDYTRLDKSLKGFKGIKKGLKDEHYGLQASNNCLCSNWLRINDNQYPDFDDILISQKNEIPKGVCLPYPFTFIPAMARKEIPLDNRMKSYSVDFIHEDDIIETSGL
jgi:DNA-directed RNA polymerase specialized sigma subunit